MQINNSGQRLLALLNDLLDLSKMESGMMEMQFSMHDLTEIVQSCIAEQQARMQERNISIEEIKADGLPEVKCDKTRIGQVITNLLSNAIKFSPDNSCITFSYNLDRVSKDDMAVCIGISDRGTGIPAEELDAVFDKFIQSAKNKDMGGTGLGLAISREIIEMHQGKIWAENNDQGGALFQFVIPLDVSQ